MGGGRDRQTNRQVLMSSCSTSLRERERRKMESPPLSAAWKIWSSFHDSIPSPSILHYPRSPATRPCALLQLQPGPQKPVKNPGRPVKRIRNMAGGGCGERSRGGRGLCTCVQLSFACRSKAADLLSHMRWFKRSRAAHRVRRPRPPFGETRRPSLALTPRPILSPSCPHPSVACAVRRHISKAPLRN